MASDDESKVSSLEMDDNISDDFEYQPKSITKRGKRATSVTAGSKPPKRPKRKAAVGLRSSPINATPASHPQPQQPSPGTSKLASPRSVRRGNQAIRAWDMYEAIRSGKSAMVTVVDEWLDSYKQDQEAGLLVLINFIVQCCGCKGVVSREMFDKMEHAEIIGILTKEFNEDSVNYPLISPGLHGKRFKAGLCEFVHVLIRSCQNSLLYDERLFSSLLALLTGLSDSQVRAFRHTSTLIAMKLMTGLMDVAVVLSARLKTTQRQRDLESNKGAGDRASDRLEELQAAVSQLQEYQEELLCIMNGAFRGVFVHRYRDRVTEIRAVCIEEMGAWLRLNPGDFLNDSYLKYLGWTLHDKQGAVRLQCVLALQGLYKEKDFIGRLELFTSRFKERMLSMVLDKDPEVAVEATQLLLLIQNMTEEGFNFTEGECDHLYPLVYASHGGLAAAAGAFLYHKLNVIITTEDSDLETGDKKRKSDFFQMLISFIIQSEFHEHGAYLVDSLWVVAGSQLRDWETMTSLLLQEPGESQGLMDEEEGALIEVMMCAIRQAAEGSRPVGRAQGKKILSMKDKKTQTQDRRRISNHFIILLPQLLAKYSADVEKVSILLRAPLYFDLETYSSAGRMERYLDLLLAQVCSIVEKHTDERVLDACARVSTVLCSNCYTFSGRTNLAFSQLLDRLIERFNTCLSDMLQGTADEDDMYSAASALKRIAAFSSARDLTSWKLFESCSQLLKIGLDSEDIDKELMVPALKCASFHLLWSKVTATSSSPSEMNLTCMKEDMLAFCSVCKSCLSLGQAEIRNQAFELLCDLLIVYSVDSFRSQPDLRVLAHPPSASLRSEMASFLMDYIFTDPEDEDPADEDQEEAKITSLCQRRSQLAGYCKLILYGVLDLNAATDVFKHYSKFYREYGDIIKETLSKTKLISPVQSAKTVCLSLQQLFSMLNPEDHSGQEFGELRDLAKRLAMSFGIDLNRVRKPLVALHMDGIRFALRETGVAGLQPPNLQPPNLLFLEILCEFSFKLLRQDRTKLVDILLGEFLPSDAALSWPLVRMYQRSLQVGSTSKSREEDDRGAKTREEDDRGPKTREEDDRGAKTRGEDDRGDKSGSPSSQGTPTAKRRRTATKGLVLSTEGRPWSDNSSVLSDLPPPALTSTVLNQQTTPLAAARPKAASSDGGSIISEPQSEDDFAAGFLVRKVQHKTRSSGPAPSEPSSQVAEHLEMLSLIEEDEDQAAGDEEEPEIEDFESDTSDRDTDYALPRSLSGCFLEDLFS